ncbi:MAG: hypothetical protein K5776_12235 [Lachnospiraceae bacterium]|nr:hypothetical protein [Lachnospiraceae bacterium]
MLYLTLTSEEALQALDNLESGLSSVDGITGYLYSIGGTILAAIAGLFGVGISVIVFVVPIIAAIVGVIVSIIEYLLPAIALFKMARKAGYKYPWMAFIPIVQTYLEFVLPRREFNVIFKTKNRSVMGIIAIALSYFGSAVVVALNAVPPLGQILDPLLPFVLYALGWRKKYDMIRTFGTKELAIPISILSIIFPFLYTITLLFLMNKDPEYGAGNYYNVPMDDV